MSTMSVTERRFREGSGEKYLKSDPTRVRCQGSSKSKLRLIRVREENPELTPDDCWPECQCTKAAVAGKFACERHGGLSHGDPKYGMADYMPVDLAEKVKIFSNNTSELFNRMGEVAQLKARNAELYERLDSLVIGIDAYDTLLEARRDISKGDIQEGLSLISIVLEDVKSEKVIWDEIRTNNTIMDKLTNTHFSVAEKLKIMTTIDQVRALVEGVYRGAERVFMKYLPDPDIRADAMQDIANVLRNLTNSRAAVEVLTDGD